MQLLFEIMLKTVLVYILLLTKTCFAMQTTIFTRVDGSRLKSCTLQVTYVRSKIECAIFCNTDAECLSADIRVHQNSVECRMHGIATSNSEYMTADSQAFYLCK